MVIWNHKLGIVFAGIGVRMQPGEVSVPHLMEEAVLGPNPLF